MTKSNSERYDRALMAGVFEGQLADWNELSIERRNDFTMLADQWYDKHGIAATAEVKTSPATLTAERKTQHGDWTAQSSLADNLVFQLTNSKNWESMGPEKRMALFNIAQKMSRICAGDPDVADHWDDISGYAFLGKKGHPPA